jgi:hypothetical protein
LRQFSAFDDPGAADSDPILDSSDCGHLIESDRALISGVDLLIQTTTGCPSPRQVGQDRANYHHFHLKAADGSGSFFASAANRQNLEAMPARGSIAKDAADRIMAGNVGKVVDVRVED